MPSLKSLFTVALTAPFMAMVQCTDHIAITATTEAPIPTHTVTKVVQAPAATFTVTQTQLRPQATHTVTKHVTAILPATATATATAPAATSTAVATSSIEDIKAATPRKSWWPFGRKTGEIVRYEHDVDHTLHHGQSIHHHTVGDKIKNLVPGTHHYHSTHNVTTSATHPRVKNGGSAAGAFVALLMSALVGLPFWQ